jgi:uncharacterized membrane protein
MNRNTVLSAIFFTAIVGLAIAGYQTYEFHVLGYAGCSGPGLFSCAQVTGSAYGAFPPGSGIATAAWGAAWWIGVLILSGSLLMGRRLFRDQEFYLFGTAALGSGFIVYLLTVELYILPQQTGELAICPFCTAQHILIIGVLILSHRLLDRPVRSRIAALTEGVS